MMNMTGLEFLKTIGCDLIMSKKIFIDCGTHMFQGFKEFINMLNIDSSWTCYSFEANPITYSQSLDVYRDLTGKGYNIVHKNIAVANRYGSIKVNCDIAESGTGQGSNILDDPPSVDKQWGHELKYLDNTVLVECIDLVDFIKNNCSKDDYVVIKMDIEGSEFLVLDSFINQLDTELIDKIYVEFHERFFDDVETYSRKKEYYKEYFLKNKIDFNEWK